MGREVRAGEMLLPSFATRDRRGYWYRRFMWVGSERKSKEYSKECLPTNQPHKSECADDWHYIQNRESYTQRTETSEVNQFLQNKSDKS